MKKLISVLLCIAMMFTFFTVISSAADGAAAGAETIFNMLMKLLSGVDWTSILSVFTTTIQTLMRLIGAA